MHTSIGMAGRIWVALRRMPSAIPRRLTLPLAPASTRARADEPNRTHGENSDTAVGPMNTIINRKETNSTATGTADSCHDGTRGDRGMREKILVTLKTSCLSSRALRYAGAVTRRARQNLFTFISRKFKQNDF